MENDWIKSICVVAFDENLGQVVELQHPPYFLESEQRSLCFLSFPDSNSLSHEGCLSYAFKTAANQGPVFCYTYFHQQRDETNSRGYTQKALVVVSQLPYFSLLKRVALLLGPLYFSHGPGLFEVAEVCFNSWGRIEPGVSRDLPLLGQVLKYSIPTTDLHLISSPVGLTTDTILQQLGQGYPGLFQDTNIFEEIKTKVIKKCLWSMWEQTIRGKSILVVAKSPKDSSALVLALLSFISPLNFVGEYFPYCTIFDCDLNQLKHTQTIIGATNPFFEKAVDSQYIIYNLESGAKMPKSVKRRRSVLNKLRAGSPDERNLWLKEHFRDLTQALLHPFTEYFYTNSPMVVSFKSFHSDEFLRDIETTSLPLMNYTSRAKAARIYADFIKTRTFLHWFNQQRERTSNNAKQLIAEATT